AQMIPTFDGERLEVVDAVNWSRDRGGERSLINEHNSCALNGVYLYSFLQQIGFEGRVELVDNVDFERARAQALVADADVVVFSTTFITSAETIVRVTHMIKGWNPAAKVIVGGAKPTQFADERETHEAARA